MADFDESKIKRDGDGKFATKDTPAEVERAEQLFSDEWTSADEFRYIDQHENTKAEGHPAHIYAKNDTQAKYMQLTHSEFIKDMEDANIRLKENPNPKDKRTAYIIPKSEISNLEDLGKIKNGWKLSEIDDETIMIYRDEPFNKKK
jgi:hypothetical protein